MRLGTAEIAALASLAASCAAVATAYFRGRGRLARLQASREAREDALAEMVYERVKEQIDGLKQDLQIERKRRLALEAELDESRKTIRTLQDELNTLRHSVAEATGSYRAEHGGN